MIYSGTVVKSHHSEGDFHILRMQLDNPSNSVENVVSVKGTVSGLPIRDGSWFAFEATESYHHKYGTQLSIVRAPVAPETWDKESLVNLFHAKNDIPYYAAEQLAETAHADLDILSDELRVYSLIRDVYQESDEEVVRSMSTNIVRHWKFINALFKSVEFLNQHGFPANRTGDIFREFGENTVEVLINNPWELLKVDGISFLMADNLAVSLCIPLDSEKRRTGAVLFCIRDLWNHGHVCIPLPNLVSSVNHIMGDNNNQSALLAIASLHKSGHIHVETGYDQHMVYDASLYEMESESAKDLMTRVVHHAINPEWIELMTYGLRSIGPKTQDYVDHFFSIADKEVTQDDLIAAVRVAVDEWGESANIVLSQKQVDGVINAIAMPVSILTGLPGTGKTTCMVAVVSILSEIRRTFLLCAPTGIAAKNLGHKTNSQAYTIHKAFEAVGGGSDNNDAEYDGIRGKTRMSDRSSGIWSYDKDNPYDVEVVVVDESSMVDQNLLYRLLSSTPYSCRVVFVGDAAQLPSVGPGNVLRDLIDSKVFPVVHLTDIFRQKEQSGIIYAAHAIHNGEFPDLESLSRDFKFVSAPTDKDVHHLIVEAATRLHASKKNFQVISPRHGGAVGVTNLNNSIRDVINPASSTRVEISVGDSTMREDDRVMVIRNDYKLGICNGDLGKISSINRQSGQVVVTIFGSNDSYHSLIEIPIKRVKSLLRLAYACTVHKSQGIDHNIIVMPMVPSFHHQLQRNLLYTAVTRARKTVILIGSTYALGQAIQNNKEDQRFTLLKQRLVKLKSGLLDAVREKTGRDQAEAIVPVPEPQQEQPS